MPLNHLIDLGQVRSRELGRLWRPATQEHERIMRDPQFARVDTPGRANRSADNCLPRQEILSAGFRSLQAVIVSAALLARQSPAGEIPFPAAD